MNFFPLPRLKIMSFYISANSKQSEAIKQKILKHSLITPKLFRRIHIWTLIDFDEIKIHVIVEHEIKPIKLKERVFKIVLICLKRY